MPLDRWKAWCARESTHLLVRGTTPDAAARKRAQNLLRFHSIVELSGEVRWETLPPGELVGKPAPMTRVDTGRAVFKDGARIEWENIRTSEGQGVRIRTWFGGKETKETVLLVPHRVYGEPDNWPAAFWMHIGMRVGALHAPAVADMLERAALSGGVREIRRDGDND